MLFTKPGANALIYFFGSRVDDLARCARMNLMAISKKVNIRDKLEMLMQRCLRVSKHVIGIAVHPDATLPFHRRGIEADFHL